MKLPSMGYLSWLWRLAILAAFSVLVSSMGVAQALNTGNPLTNPCTSPALSSSAKAALNCSSSATPSQDTTQAAAYQRAAALYDQAATQCSEPGASCMRQNAGYLRCEAAQFSGGGSCGVGPSCSTACSSSGSGGGISGGAIIGSGLTQKQQLAITGLGLALQWLGNRHHNDNGAQVPADNSADEAQSEADEAQAQAAIAEANAAFSNQVNLRNALTSGADPSSLGNSPGQGQDDPMVALRNQLTASGSSSDGSPQIVASNNPSDSSDPTAALRAQLTAQAQAETAADPTSNGNSQGIASGLTALGATQPPVPANLVPQNPQVNAALQDSEDQPDPSQTESLAGMFQSAGQDIKDGLNNLVTSGKTLASNLMNDPVVQWATSDKGSLTTVPLPAQQDSADTATNKVYGQAVVGFGDLLKGLATGPVGIVKGGYSYGAKMVNQMGADLGLASNTILETPQGGSQ
jgi:hypothetical protein